MLYLGTKRIALAIVVGVLATAPLTALSTTPHAGADPAVKPEVAILMSQENMSAGQAQSFLTQQANSYDKSESLQKTLNMSPDNFAINPGTGDLLGYYTNSSTEQEMVSAGVIPVKVPYSAEQLSTIMDSIVNSIPLSASGFHTAALNVRSGTIDVSGTVGFFASPEWLSASNGKPVTTKVEDESDVASPAVAEPIPGEKTETDGNSIGGGRIAIFFCSAGWVTQQAWMVTAGHCTFDPYQTGGITTLGRPVKNAVNTAFGTTSNSSYKSDGVDYGKITMYAGTASAGTGYYANYNGGKNRIYNVTRPMAGSYVCKYGITTHATCGALTYKVVQSYGSARRIRDLWEGPQLTIRPGDSGGPVVVYRNSSSGMAVGMASGDNGSTGYISILDDALRHYGATLNTATGSES